MTSTVAPKVPDGSGPRDPRDPHGPDGPRDPRDPLGLRAGAPLLDAWLRASASGLGRTARMSIPGHKNRLDLTGAVVADDIPLYGGLTSIKQADGLLGEAERRAGRLWGADWCRFSVAGSTHGNQALALAVGQPGDEVIVSRTLHRSLLLGLVLAGLRPVWVRPQVDPASGLPGAVPVDAVRAALAAHPGARAVFLGDPSYVGTTGDLAGHAAAAHEAGRPLIVDAAWAAHLGFHPSFPPHALAAGADAMVTSAHKALPSWTQGALVLARTGRLDPARLERAFDATHTTSPTGTILASIDAARELLARDGEALCGRMLAAVATARIRLAAVPGLAVLAGPDVEPGKLVVLLAGTGAHGHAVEADLIAAGMPVEMADRDTIVPIVTLADEPRHVARFTEALVAAIERHRSAPRHPAAGLAWGLDPQVVLPPREAFFAAHETVPAEAAAGRVSAELVAPYPPGVPVLAPGELVTAEIVAALRAVLADGGRVAYAADPTLATVQVVAGALTPGRASRVTVRGWRRSSPRPSARPSGGGISAGPGRRSRPGRRPCPT
jgi:arginine decarboxylase